MGKKLYDQLRTLTTESRNDSSRALDRLSTVEILKLINNEDRTVAEAVTRVLPQIAKTVELVARSFRSGGRLLYAGAGTSGRLGVLDAAECPPTFGVPPRMVQAIIAGGRQTLVRSREGVEDDTSAAVKDIARLKPGTKDTVIGIAASGRTPYSLAVLKYAKQRKAATVFLVCNSATKKPAYVDVLIAPLVGPEVLTGSTRMKSGTATKLILNMITTTAMVQIGKSYGNLMVDLKATSQKLSERSRRILVETLGVNYKQAGTLLDQAHGQVKTAIAMYLLDLEYAAAKKRLALADGKLSRALDLHS
ncbi:MAG: N-acetylmuramic acid 6-phosphate etherase [Candidatus Zixiibacteriota bacterium]